MTGGKFRRDPEQIRLRHEAVSLLVAAGHSDGRIAQELGVTPRTVLRDREKLGLPPAIPRNRKGVRNGSSAAHGTLSRSTYDQCPCTPCRAAYAAYKLRENHEKGRFDRYYVTCTVCGKRHHVDDPTNYQCTSEPAPRRRE